MKTTFSETFRASHATVGDFVQQNASRLGIFLAASAAVFYVIIETAVNASIDTLSAGGTRDAATASAMAQIEQLGLLVFASFWMLGLMSLHMGFLRYAREGAPLLPFVNLLSWRGLKYAVRSLLYVLLIMATLLPAYVGATGVINPDNPATLLAALMSLFAFVWLGVRLTPWTSTFADDAGTPIRAGFAATRGRFWRTFVRIIFVPLPLYFVARLIGGLAESGSQAAFATLGSTSTAIAAIIAAALFLLFQILPTLLFPGSALAVWNDLAETEPTPADDKDARFADQEA